MDRERKKRQRLIRLILAEILMVASAVAIMIVLTLLVMGYRINQDGRIKQVGMVQLETAPTGAKVVIDGKSTGWQTKGSQMLSGGKHQVAVQKKGYTGWTKTVKIKPGWLTDITYPRLFLKKRPSEELAQMSDLEFFSIGKEMIVWRAGELWHTLEIHNADVEPKVLTGILPENASLVRWCKEKRQVLLKGEKTGDWWMVDLDDTAKSVNLAEEYDVEIVDARFSGDGGVLVLVQDSLRYIDLVKKTIVIWVDEAVEQFVNVKTDVAVVINGAKGREIAVYKNDKLKKILNIGEKMILKLEMVNYEKQNYVLVGFGQELEVYKVNGWGENSMKVKKILRLELGSEVLSLKSRENLVLVNGAGTSKVVDLAKKKTWNVAAKASWLDDSLLWDSKDGKMVVWDFDGTNKRILSKISGQYEASLVGAWLYFVMPDEAGVSLVREKVVE